MFTWVFQRLADATLVMGRTVEIDATTLEANAAMRSIVRRDTGERDDAFLTRLAEASGLSTPTRAELARFDRTRTKKGSTDDWTHPHDPDAKITNIKDDRTHLAHTAEHAIDLEAGAIVGVTVLDASAGDTTTLVHTLVTATEQVEAVGAPGIAEVVADTGNHSNETMVGYAAIGVRGDVSEPDRGRRHWTGRRRRGRGVCQPAADSRRARNTATAAAGRTAGTAQRASLRDRRDAARASARASQHLETAARPGLRLQPGVAHAAPDGRGHAAEPAGPRGGASGRADRPPERVLGACAPLLGPRSAPISRICRGEDRQHVTMDTRSPTDA